MLEFLLLRRFSYRYARGLGRDATCFSSAMTQRVHSYARVSGTDPNMLSFWFKKILFKKKITCKNSIRRGLEELTEFQKKNLKKKRPAGIASAEDLRSAPSSERAKSIASVFLFFATSSTNSWHASSVLNKKKNSRQSQAAMP